MKLMRLNASKFLFLIFLFSIKIKAQELVVIVNVDPEQIQNQEKQIFQDMKINISQFMNTKRWTNDKFSAIEKIKVSINIKLQSMPSSNKYKAITQIMAERPVFGVAYSTPIFNFLDKDFNFEYSQSQPIDFNDANYTNNLSSLLAFYAYVILAMDYDSFSKYGGNVFIEKAFQTLNNAQASNEAGWKQFDDNPNSRYWLIENLNNPQFKDYRDANFIYHRQGLDVMFEKPDDTRSKIMESTLLLKKTNDVRPNSCLLRTYFNTKDVEIINIMKEATLAEKGKIIDLLKVMDPTNSEKYDELAKQ